MRRLAALLILALGLVAATPAAAAPRCLGWPGFEAAARRNGESLATLTWSPYGAPEKGWAVYAPLVGHVLGSDCAADTPGFAWALGRWQGFHGLAPTGVFGPAEFAIMKTHWQQARPFVRLRATGVCPDPPPAADLVTATPAETLSDHPMQLTAGAMAAYRALVAAARRETPDLQANDFRLVSSFRSPAYDAARCAQDGNCDGVRRATCSAHRTGRAMDIALPAAANRGLDSTSAENRAHMTASPAYAWMTANAWRFGFVNYTFEPWHWEWIGPAWIRAQPREP